MAHCIRIRVAPPTGVGFLRVALFLKSGCEILWKTATHEPYQRTIESKITSYRKEEDSFHFELHQTLLVLIESEFSSAFFEKEAIIPAKVSFQVVTTTESGLNHAKAISPSRQSCLKWSVQFIMIQKSVFRKLVSFFTFIWYDHILYWL